MLLLCFTVSSDPLEAGFSAFDASKTLVSCQKIRESRKTKKTYRDILYIFIFSSSIIP